MFYLFPFLPLHYSLSSFVKQWIQQKGYHGFKFNILYSINEKSLQSRICFLTLDERTDIVLQSDIRCLSTNFCKGFVVCRMIFKKMYFVGEGRCYDRRYQLEDEEIFSDFFQIVFTDLYCYSNNLSNNITYTKNIGYILQII